MPLENTIPKEAFIPVLVMMGGLLVNSLFASGYFIKMLYGGRLDGRLSGSLVPVLSAPLWTGVLLVACLCVSVCTPYKFFAFFFAVIPCLTLVFYQIAPFQFWNIKVKNIVNYIFVGTWLLFVILIPLIIVTAVSNLFFKILGISGLQPSLEILLRADGVGKVIFFFVYAVVIAPFLEEMGFRGFLYPLLKSRMGKWRALLLVSFLFAAIHLHIPTLLPLFLLGVCFTLLYEATGSLGYPILLHSLFNGLNCIWFLVLKPFIHQS